jgi:hypothetical protein
MTPEQEQKLNEVYEFTQSLKSSSSIPYDVDGAFRDRLRNIFALYVSSKSADSEDQSVNEAGSGTYSVMGDPDGFLEITVDGTLYYIPYFT